MVREEAKMKVCDISVGMLDKKIALQREDLTSDGGGGYTKTWTTYLNPWARITPVSANEAMVSQQLQHTVTHDIIIRYNSGVKAADSILYKNTRYNIKSIINVEMKGAWLQIKAEEGAGN
jgi:SPP1 family predicted phage head-tail adaptor